MPSWKKIITSGSSDASLAALFVTNAVTSSIFSGSRFIGASFTGSFTGSLSGSLFGTSSFAVSSSRATTSSFALTSSFISTTGTNAFIQGGNSFGATALLGTNDAQSLVLESNGTARVTLDSSGNTSIATGYQFTSAGTLNWGTSAYTIGQLSWDTAGGANNYAAVYSQGIYNLRLGTTTYPTAIFVTASNGNVGIGTTSPIYKLHSSGIINSDGGYVNSQATFTKSYSLGNIAANTTYTLGQLDFGTVYTHHFKVRVSSYAGTKTFDFIGYQAGLSKTVSGVPYQQDRFNSLDVVLEKIVDGSNQITGVKIGIKNGSSGEDYIYSATIECLSVFSNWTPLASNTTLTTFTPGTSNYIIAEAGNVGIGTTSPATQLHLSGSADIRMSNNANSTGYDIGLLGGLSDANAYVYQRANAALILGTNNTDRIRILGNGNVGIGATSPGANLQIGYQNSSTSEMLRLGVLYTGSPTQRGTITWHDSVDVTGQIDTRFDGSKVNMYFGSLYNNAYNSTVRLTILGDGNVGIGTTSPYEKLEVAGAVSATGASAGLSAQGTATTISVESGVGYLRSVDWGSEYKSLVIEGQNISMQTGVGSTTSRLTINSSGNVGIGTTTPSFPLSFGTALGNKIAIYDVGSGTGYGFGIQSGLLQIFANDVADRVGIGYGNSTSFTETLSIKGVNVGIGTTTPTVGKLQINTGAANNNALTIQATSQTSITYGIGIDASSNFAIYDNFAASQRVTLNGSGNVGIGTTTPLGRLDVKGKGSSYLDGLNIVDSSNAAKTSFVHTAGSLFIGTATDASGADAPADFEQRIRIYEPTATTTNPILQLGDPDFTILQNGNVGIGTTTPTEGKLVIANSGPSVIYNKETSQGVNSFWNSSDGGLIQFGAASAHPLLLFTNNTEKVRITSGGNVGIGTTSPSENLDVYEANNTSWAPRIVARDQTVAAFIGAYNSNPGVFAHNSALNAWAALYVNTIDGTSTNGGNVIMGGNVGIGTVSPQKPLEAISATNDFVSVGVNQIADEAWTGIHFGYREANNLYRKSAIVFQRTDLTENNAQGKVHILNGPQSGAGNATLSDARLTIAENGNVGIGTTTPTAKLDIASSATGTTMTVGRFTGHPSIKANTDAGGYLVLDSNGNATSINNYVSDNVWLAAGGGSVGIGLTSPNARLDVAGGINSRNTRVDTTRKYPIGHHSSGETVFEIDPTWTQAQLQDYFGSTGFTWNTDSTAPGGYSIQVDGALNVGNVVYSSGFPFIPVDTGSNDWYYMECWIRNEAGSVNNHYMGGIDYDASFGNLGGNPGSYTYNVMLNYNPGTTWTKVFGYWNGYGSSSGGSGTGNTNNWVNNTKYFGPQALFNYSNSSGTRRCYISGWRLIKVNNPGNRYFQNNVLVNGDTGIGTTSPAYKLDVLGTIRATGDVIAYSDARVKDNVEPIKNALEKVISLRGVSYNRKDTDDKSRKIGVIAQEVLPIIPEVVSKDQNGNYSVSYGNMVGLLIEAVKEQQKQIEELKYLLENKKKKK